MTRTEIRRYEAETASELDGLTEAQYRRIAAGSQERCRKHGARLQTTDAGRICPACARGRNPAR